MHRKPPSHLLALLALASPLLAQDQTATAPLPVTPELAQAIRREGLENSKVMEHLDHLTNQIGARLTGSESFRLACEWTREQFEKMGLANARLEKWGEYPVGWNRGQWSGRITQPEPIELQVATDAWTAGTRGNRKGRVVALPKDAEAIRAAPRDFGGAWLALLAGRNVPAETKAACREAGALGFLRSGHDGDAKYPTRLRVFGTHLVKWDNLPVLPEIAIRSDQWNVLAAMLADGKPVEAEFDIRNQFRKGPVEVHNVIAEIPGTEHPDEVVVVCGHLDSWHQATGTTDNGTGATSTLEAARILAAVGARPKRTIRFILWGGEEQGLLGSLAYVNKHRAEMAKVSCVFNHDSGTNWAQSLAITPGMKDDMQRVIAPILAMKPPDSGFDGPVFALNVREKISGGGGSDHASFARAGVPPFSWGLKGRSDYFRYTWHSQWDTYDVAIPEYQRHTSTVIALAALGVANLPHLLDRTGVTINPEGADRKAQLEGMLGVEVDENRFKSVKVDGIAKKAGFVDGDVVVKVNTFTVETMLDLRRALREQEPPWQVTVKRGGAEVAVRLERPAAAESRPQAETRQGAPGGPASREAVR
jgi:hypothetical protein